MFLYDNVINLVLDIINHLKNIHIMIHNTKLFPLGRLENAICNKMFNRI